MPLITLKLHAAYNRVLGRCVSQAISPVPGLSSLTRPAPQTNCGLQDQEAVWVEDRWQMGLLVLPLDTIPSQHRWLNQPGQIFTTCFGSGEWLFNDILDVASLGHNEGRYVELPADWER